MEGLWIWGEEIVGKEMIPKGYQEVFSLSEDQQWQRIIMY